MTRNHVGTLNHVFFRKATHTDCESDAVELEFCEELATKLATTSSEILVNIVSANNSVKRLTKLRDYAASLCRKERTECPKGRLVRRLAKQKGAKVEFKLATDIIELIRFWKSGEENQQLREMFVRPNDSVVLSCTDSTSARGDETIDILCCMEKLESKLMAVTAESSASISAMKQEINELQAALELRDTKIQSLESEISALKSRCKVNQEKMSENLKETVFELDLVKGKLQNFEQSLMKTSKQFEKIKNNLHRETKAEKNRPLGTAVGEINNITINSKSMDKGIESLNYSENANGSIYEADDNNNQNNNAKSKTTITTGAANGVNVNSQVADSVDVGQNSEINGVDTDVEFVGIQRKTVKRIFLGGIKKGVTTQKIVQYMKDRSIEPTFVRLMKSKRKGTTSARVNVYAKDFNIVKESNFWPEGVRARLWLSQVKWQSYLGKEHSAEK